MNIILLSGFSERLQHRISRRTRLFDVKTNANSFAATGANDTIQRIYVINLDRKPDRWRQVSKELRRFRGQSGVNLSIISRRFSAVDARYSKGAPDEKTLTPYYSLADQLQVEPNPLLKVDNRTQARRIKMTPQEIAVAQSHISVWRLIAASDTPYTLVLEDDVFFRRGFARDLDVAWTALMSQAPNFDLFYLSFKEVGVNAKAQRYSQGPVRKPNGGIWQASGYILSKKGAQKLLELLPTYGPIDLWLNLQFSKLNVFVAPRSIIEQRIDTPSTNSYSVMPILSQVGVFVREKPLLARPQNLPRPIFAWGEPGSGLTPLATALSMLGYTCCSDIKELPEQENVLLKKRGRRFNAYVNIGSLNGGSHANLAKLYPKAQFIVTSPDSILPPIAPSRVLYLPSNLQDKWEELCSFLKQDYPAFQYPACDEIGQRTLTVTHNRIGKSLPITPLKFDSSPWIVPLKEWHGIAIAGNDQKPKTIRDWSGESQYDSRYWKLRDDTFPSNLSLFSPDNFMMKASGGADLVFRREATLVRKFTSAAIASQQKFLYGNFTVELKPSNVSGLITGVFLHRNGPRQEIDIEFPGKDTTKLLVNVYYNPGIDGTKLEYGYRGTPLLIELEFDAAEEFHSYGIEWRVNTIRWLVDSRVVHERVLWNPTPIPNLPMEFNINLWHSKSKELAGELDVSRIPASTIIKSIRIDHYGK